MPVALKQFRISFGALPHQPRGVWVATVALLFFAIAAWGTIGSRIASAQDKIAILYPSSAMPVEMFDAKKYTVAQVLEGLPVGLRFEMLLKRTGVLSELAGAGSYTVFAPADNYFDYIPGGLPALTRNEERALAERHVLKSVVVPTAETGGTYLTLGAEKLPVAVGANGVVSVADGFAIRGYYAQNGVVYLISRVLVP